MFTPSRSIFAFILLALNLSFCAAVDRPNILWITSEDHGPEMGCYGDEFATTPHLDALATRGLRYDFAWSTASVCAPARTALISGLYPPSTGGHNMRSKVTAPAGKPAYPTFLRDAGYYCTNNSKEDYNLILPADLWDESSAKAHWRNRPDGKPFFAIFNATVSHESKIRTRPHEAIHD
ncbi:MAG: sulfatase-like hydrolase/transferase, partial [Verrucomicrobiia bacterium]